jgi:putative transposase
MKLGDLLRETLSVDCDGVWENERTPTPVRVFRVRLHSMGLSLREIVAVFEWLDVDRSHGAVWNWTRKLSEAQEDPPTASPSRVAVDEKQIEVDGEKKWLYAAIDTDSKLLLEVEVFSRRGTRPPKLGRKPSTPALFQACAQRLLLACETPTRRAASSSTSPA